MHSPRNGWSPTLHRLNNVGCAGRHDGSVGGTRKALCDYTRTQIPWRSGQFRRPHCRSYRSIIYVDYIQHATWPICLPSGGKWRALEFVPNLISCQIVVTHIARRNRHYFEWQMWLSDFIMWIKPFMIFLLTSLGIGNQLCLEYHSIFFFINWSAVKNANDYHIHIGIKTMLQKI